MKGLSYARQLLRTPHREVPGLLADCLLAWHCPAATEAAAGSFFTGWAGRAAGVLDPEG